MNTDKTARPKAPLTPKNVRWTKPRVCAFCRYFEMVDGSSECVLPDGPIFDTGDMKYWETVCDTFKRGRLDPSEED